MRILELRDANIKIGGRTLIHDANFSIEAGQCVAVMGPSGTGKSTLLQTIAGIRTPGPDQVLLEGQDIAQLSTSARDRTRLSRLGMVFQFGELLPELTALENVALPSRYLGLLRAQAHERAGEWLNALGLADLHDARPERMSGGQVQRVAIARAMAHGPRLVLADEPTGMLDEATSREVVRLLVDSVKSAQAALLFVTHDRSVAAASDHVLKLSDGRLVAA